VFSLKYSWKGKWKDGELSIEAETMKELEEALRELVESGGLNPSQTNKLEVVPSLPRTLGCTDAVKSLLENEWGKTPRSLNEIRVALESNDICFPRTVLASTLSILANKNTIHRIKKEGKWKYFGGS